VLDREDQPAGIFIFTENQTMNDPNKTSESSIKTKPSRLPKLYLIGSWLLGLSIVWIILSSILISIVLHDYYLGGTLRSIPGGYPAILFIYSGFLYGLPLGLIGIFLQLFSFRSLLRK